MKNQLLCRAALLLLFVSLDLLQAQNYNQIAPPAAPQTLSPPPVAPVPEPESIALPRRRMHRSTNPDDLVVPVLKGLVFLPSPNLLHANGSTVAGIATSNIGLLEKKEFGALLSPYIGHSLTFGQLDTVTNSVVSYYRNNNHPLVDVVVPEQDVHYGTIQIVVTEFRVGEIRVEGNKWFSDRAVVAPLSLQHYAAINSNQMLGMLDAANANPFRKVNLLYEPSTQPGYTDLVLQTQDRFPLRVYSGYDNSGTPITGRGRWNMGVNWGNALWHDQQLNYQFTSSTDLWHGGHSSGSGSASGASFLAHSLSWSMPLAFGSSISVFGAYERSVPNVGQDFGLVGLSGQASVRYSFPLPRTKSFTQSIQAGYDFKTTNNNLDFGGYMISRNSTEVDQFPLIYSASRVDSYGVTGFTTTLVYSPGGITPANNDAAFQPAAGQSGRIAAHANYTYWRNDVNRLTRLPYRFALSTRLITQMSNRSLLNTEQISVGGPEILRGYDPYSILGDQGFVLSNELRTRTFGRANRDGVAKFLGQSQFLGFWDYADLHNKNATETTIANIAASSVGVGFRYNLSSYASLRFDFGWQLQQLPFPTGRGTLANFSILVGN